MFRKRSATPDPKQVSVPSKEIETRPETPKSVEVVIANDTASPAPTSPPEIKSVGTSLLPPPVKPQRAEINDARESSTPKSTVSFEKNAFNDAPDPASPPVEATKTTSPQSPKSPKSALARGRAKSIVPPPSLDKQLSSITETPSIDEKALSDSPTSVRSKEGAASRRRPTTAAVAFRAEPARSRTASVKNLTLEPDPIVMNSPNDIQAVPEITVEDEFGISSTNRILEIEEVASKSEKAEADSTKKSAGSSPEGSLKKISKKKLVQIETPPRKQLQNENRALESRTKQAVPPDSGSGGSVTARKSKLKQVPNSAKPLVTTLSNKKSKMKTSVVENESSSSVELLNDESFTDDSLKDESHEKDLSLEQLEVLEKDLYANETQVEKPSASTPQSPKPRRRLDEPKYKAESVRAKSAKKPQSAKSKAASRPSSSNKNRAHSGSSNTLRRRETLISLDDHGLSAMGLMDPSEYRSGGQQQDAVSRRENRRTSQPAPPNHAMASISQHRTAAKKGVKLKRNSSARRKSIEAISKIPGLAERIPSVGRFGHYDVDDVRSKSMNPVTSRFGRFDEVEDEGYNNSSSSDIQSESRYVNQENSNEVYASSNSSLERYSDRISRKYDEAAKQRFLASSAIQAAQQEGLVSSEAALYLEQYMTQRKSHEEQPQQKIKSKTIPPLKPNQGIADDDQMSGGAPKKTATVRKLDRFTKNPPFQPMRGSIMDDDSPPIQSNNLEEDVKPKPKPVPKTRITIVSKPRKKKPLTPQMLDSYPKPTLPGDPMHAASHPLWSLPGYGAASFYPPHLPAYNSSMLAPALPPPPPLGTHASSTPASSFASVAPGLVPARIRLATIPVVMYRQSYVIEPTGHPPGTYLPPDDFNSDGGMLTYISAFAGGYPGNGGDFSIEGGFVGPRPRSKIAPVRPIERVAKKIVNTEKLAAKEGVRSLIEKGLIGRGAR